jgi:H/ACA ribonucleoprotein complex subunit 2
MASGTPKEEKVKKDKKEKKEKSSKHSEDGVKKEKKDKKKKKSSDDNEVVLPDFNQEELEKAVSSLLKTPDDALVPFANPLADQDQTMTLLKMVRKGIYPTPPTTQLQLLTYSSC